MNFLSFLYVWIHGCFFSNCQYLMCLRIYEYCIFVYGVTDEVLALRSGWTGCNGELLCDALFIGCR